MENDTGNDRNYDIEVELLSSRRSVGQSTVFFRNKVRRDTKLKFYKKKSVAAPVLSYRCELTTKQQDSTIRASEMAFF